MRVATWNTKQAVAPVLPPDRAWAWMEEHIDPDIVVLTEASDHAPVVAEFRS